MKKSARRLFPLFRPGPVRTGLILWLSVWIAFSPLLDRPALASFLGFGKFTIKDEKELGKKFAVLVKSKLPLVEDPEIAGYVRDVVARLAQAMPPQPWDIETNVILHNSMNAFAAPAGYVFVHTGLILNFDHESEMAGVLAHELAHVSQRHIAHRIERMQALSLLSLAGMLAGIFLGGKYTEGIIIGSQAMRSSAMLKYSREDESEADQVGMNYLVDSGYPPQGLAGSFRKMEKLKWLGGRSDIPTYLSTHPHLNERIADIDQRVRTLPADIQSRPDDDFKFRRVQTLLRAYFTDPATALQYFNSKGEKMTCLDRMGIGVALSRVNRVKDADQAFEKALACSGRDPLILREAGRFHFKKGDIVKADLYLSQALEINSNDLMAVFFQARLLNELGQHAKAADLFRRVLWTVPEDPEVHEYYGKALGADGRFFPAHLHLAYAALYSGDMRQLDFHMKKAERLAKTDDEKADYETFKKTMEERKEFW